MITDSFEKNKLDVARRTIRECVHQNGFNKTLEEQTENYDLLKDLDKASDIRFAKLLLKALGSVDALSYRTYSSDINKNALITASMKKETNKEDIYDTFFISEIFGIFNDLLTEGSPVQAYRDYLTEKHGENALYIDAIISGKDFLENAKNVSEEDLNRVQQSYNLLVKTFGEHDAPTFS